MRDIIKKLVKEYYESDTIIRDMVVQEDKGKKIINIFSNLAALKWRLYENGIVNSFGFGKPDLELANKIIEERKTEKAKHIYGFAKNALISENKLNAFHSIWNETEPRNEEGHARLLTYSLRALFFMKILTPYEYDTTQDIIDESGIEIGTKLLPKDEEALDIAMGTEIKNDEVK